MTGTDGEFPPDVAQALATMKEISRSEAFVPVFKAFGLSPEQPLAPDIRPKWVRKLAAKVLESFTLARAAKGKSDSWKKGAASGAISAWGSLLRENPTAFLKYFTTEQINFLLELMEKMIRAETEEYRLKSRDEASDYFAGLAYGLKEALQPSGYPAGGSHRMLLDLCLLLAWQHVEKCHTTTELYYELLGDDKTPNQWLGDLESFQSYCRTLGLRLSARGRPKKS